MRILVANDGLSDVGGVQAYLDVTLAALASRGHSVALAYCTDSGLPASSGSDGYLRFHVSDAVRDSAIDAIRRWAPDVCYVHNMHDLTVDSALTAVAPVVKFMHGYFGTCIGGLKMHRFPRAIACDRTLGPACVPLFLARRCGQLSAQVLVTELRWAHRQQDLFADYAAIVVASDHMRREYHRHGAKPSKVHVNPLFPTNPLPERPVPPPDQPAVAFLGRMTHLKGGDVLIRAVSRATTRLGRAVPVQMIGDGPQRRSWEALARRLGVACAFTGWVDGDRRWDLLRGCSVVALPSVWPEPFGLVGLEAGALGLPVVASDVGGVREWLHDGVNGVLVPAPASPDAFGDALVDLLTDTARQVALRRGARRVASEMTVTRHVERLEAVFRTVAA